MVLLGYSPVYKTFVALAEIGGGLTLAIPRTALLGALFLLPVMVNVVAIDVCYGVEPGATLVALLICGCLWLVIRPHVPRLKEVVLLPASAISPWRLAALGLLLAAAFGFAYWTANFNNRLPTPIDGAWSVASPAGAPTAPSPTDVFFERNRAHLATFRLSDGRDEAHHFEVDNTGSIHVWQAWLTKGALLYEGRVRDNGAISSDRRSGDTVVDGAAAAAPPLTRTSGLSWSLWSGFRSAAPGWQGATTENTGSI